MELVASVGHAWWPPPPPPTPPPPEQHDSSAAFARDYERGTFVALQRTRLGSAAATTTTPEQRAQGAQRRWRKHLQQRHRRRRRRFRFQFVQHRRSQTLQDRQMVQEPPTIQKHSGTNGLSSSDKVI